jgi:serine phosphatase RsbU (regulator of sigma subunit)
VSVGQDDPPAASPVDPPAHPPARFPADAPSDLGLAERLARMATVAAALVPADSIEAVTEVVVGHLAAAAGADVASLSLRVDDDTLRLVGVRGGRAEVTARWQSYSVHDNNPVSEAVRTGRPVVLRGEQEITRRFPGLEMAVTGERSVLCLPLRVGGRCIGVASMTFLDSREVGPAELLFLSTMVDTSAQAIERVRVSAEAADKTAKLQFLADASVELSSCIDYEVTLANVARLGVPWFGDWCSIALDQDGELRTLAVAHVDPRKVALAEEYERRFPAAPDAERGAYQVLRTGRSELVTGIDDDMIRAAVSDPEELELLLALDIRSILRVPLTVHERILGVLTWVAGETGRVFGAEDLAFAEDLAHRASLAIDTAQLHSQLNDVATRLQRAVLPGELPRPDGWELAACYLQSGSSEAGGDFYDVTELGDGRLAVFVGDVMGRGVGAAAAMAQMRAAIRALVTVGPEPRAVLVALDRLFAQYDFHQLVTLVYAVLDPERGQVEVANAGHPAPLVRRADGTVEPVVGDPGLLLGAGGGERCTVTARFGPGDTLLAFTDGLVERRDEDIDEGVARLARGCAHAGPDGRDGLAQWLTEVVESSRDARRDDDVAVLAVRRSATGLQ